VSRKFAEIYKVIKVVDAQGQEVEIPHDAEGLIFSNISSFAGGSQLWEDSNIRADCDDSDPDEPSPRQPEDAHAQWQPMSSQDGLLEVVAVTGALHLAQIKAGISSSLKLSQSSAFEIHLTQSLPLEFDGEPMRTRSALCTLSITRSSPALMMRRSADSETAAASEAGGRASCSDEVLLECLDLAVQKSWITTQNKECFIEDFSRRMEKRIQRGNKTSSWLLSDND